MARKPTPRDNYRQDAITLHRILGAIETDDRSDPTWVAAVRPHLEAAFKLLMEHRPKEAGKEPGKDGVKENAKEKAAPRLRQSA